MPLIAVGSLEGAAVLLWGRPDALLLALGVFSALFGSGGFLYAIYLSGRIEAAERLRVTQSTLIGFSTLTRAVLFLRLVQLVVLASGAALVARYLVA